MAEQRRRSGGGIPDNVLPLPGIISDEDAALISGRPRAEDEEGIPEESEAEEEPQEEAPADIDVPDEPAAKAENESFEKLAEAALRWSSERIHRTLESLLFVADKPLTEEVIRRHTGLDVRTIRDAMHALQALYDDSCRGIVLSEVAGGWQLRTNPESAEVIRRFLKVKPQRLTRAALETLAIVAYRQPVTRAEIEDIRAVDCGAVLKALLERRLIRIVGKREEAGRPLIYGTSKEFLEFFNLRDLGSLPTLREFQELSKESEEVVEKELGAEAKKGVASIVQDLRDRSFEAKLKESTAEADAALADLEDALAGSEAASLETQRLLAGPEESGAEGSQSEESGHVQGS